jgi:hypothetical protein
MINASDILLARITFEKISLPFANRLVIHGRDGSALESPTFNSQKLSPMQSSKGFVKSAIGHEPFSCWNTLKDRSSPVAHAIILRLSREDQE